MTDPGHHDFELDDTLADGPSSARPGERVPSTDLAEHPAPILVVEYRTRWFSSVLVPPALILAVAAVLIAYSPHLAALLAPPRPVPRVKTTARDEPPSAPARPPIVLEIKPIPTSEMPVIAEEATVAEQDAEPEPPRVAVAEVEAPSPERTLRILRPEPPLTVDAGEALERIQREAEEIQARQEETRQLKAHQADLERVREAQAAQAREAQDAQVRLLAERDRAQFRQDLLEALRTFGSRAGPQILEVAERYAIEPGRGMEMEIARDLKGRSDRLTRAQRVAVLRSHGLPEPLILGDLIRLEQQRRTETSSSPRHPGVRSPRVDYGAVVHATRQYLAIAPDAKAPPAIHATIMPGQLGLLGQQ